MAYDVIFLPSEISVTPDGVKYILSDGHAVPIHPVVYAHYLRFIMFQGRREKCKELIDTLSTLIQEQKDKVVHVGHALLGQCYFLSGDYQMAAESLLIATINIIDGNRKMSNAWQLAVLLFYMWKNQVSNQVNLYKE